MKAKKTISAILAGVMLTMGAYSFAIAEENEVIYTYLNESGNTVNITQAQLDAEHWNVDALGDTPPVLYEDFPMSIDKFVNDTGELYLDVVYLKTIEDFEKVNLTIQDLITEQIISQDIKMNSFYSPQLDIGHQYVLTLTQTINNNTKQYQKVVSTKKIKADMPDYIQSGENGKILIADVNELKQNQHIDNNGMMNINAAAKVYDKVQVAEFADYCDNMEPDHIYRIFAKDESGYHGGFIKGNDAEYIYDYGIDVGDIDSLYAVSPASKPSAVLPDTVKQNAESMTFADHSFRISDGSSADSKYKAMKLELHAEQVSKLLNATSGSTEANINILAKGDSTIGLYYWVAKNDGTMISATVTPEYGTTTIEKSINLRKNKFGIQDGDSVVIYAAVYFTTSTDGYGIMSMSMGAGYDDDVTSSITQAYADTSSPVEMPTFTQYNLTDGYDADVFYLKGLFDLYKVSIRNRSTQDQAKLDAGIMCNGSKEKYLTIYSGRHYELEGTTDPANVLMLSEDEVYTISKNADVSVYTYGSSEIFRIFAVVQPTSIHLANSNRTEYQISYIGLEE